MISMRALFQRQEQSTGFVSLRHSLENHPDGISMSVRQANARLTTVDKGDGFSRGCRRPGTRIEDVLGLTGIDFPGDQDPLLELPGWAAVAGNTTLVRRKTEG